jgi:hypothetical protein
MPNHAPKTLSSYFAGGIDVSDNLTCFGTYSWGWTVGQEERLN